MLRCNLRIFNEVTFRHIWHQTCTYQGVRRITRRDPRVLLKMKAGSRARVPGVNPTCLSARLKMSKMPFLKERRHAG
jgi:hypothetical protein